MNLAQNSRLHTSTLHRPARRGRRANYATIFGLLIFAIVGFGALALDIAYMRMAQLEAQDAADAASQAALVVFRRTGDIGRAETTARRLLTRNRVAGVSPSLGEVSFGTWSQPPGAPTGVFMIDGASPNAVRVEVGRTVPFLLAPVIGFDQFQATGRATSATRNLHVVLSIDITNSWSPDNFRRAREASELFLDVLGDTAGPFDRLGMNVWSGRYAWEFTPMFTLRDTAALDSTRAQWAQLYTASKPGIRTGPPHAPGCNINGANNAYFNTPPHARPAGGCYPNMPREYMGLDNRNCTHGSECGTDHTVGLTMSRQMFEEETDEAAFRALILLTDGQPNSLAASHGLARIADGFEETRWREYQAPVPHPVGSIRSESIAISHTLWEDLRTHIWVVSFVAHEPFMPAMVQGQGYYQNTSDPEALIAIFEDIVNSLPLALVE